MDGWMDGWMYVCMYIYIYICIHICIYIYICRGSVLNPSNIMLAPNSTVSSY